MSPEIIRLLILSSLFLLLFASAEWFYHRLKLEAEYTRKYVHVVTGLLTLLFPVMLTNHLWVMLICGSFLLILLLSLKFSFLPSINAIKRFTLGSVLYPVAVYFSFYVYSLHQDASQGSRIWFYLPVLVMAFADPVASLSGRKWPKGVYRIGNETKTLTGTMFFFVVALLVCAIIQLLLSGTASFSPVLWIFFVLIAMATAGIEAISKKGVDNLSIPLTALAVMQLAYQNWGLFK